MTWRVVQISSNSKAELKLNYLVVRNGDVVRKVFIPEIAILIVESTAVSITASLLCELSANKVKVIFCDEKRLPYGELIPYYGSHDSVDKLRHQIRWTDESKKAIWMRIIAMKITHQKALLEKYKLFDSAQQLGGYLDQLLPGDESNREGHSAKVYFNALFGKDFSRRESDDARNSALNYGYAVIHAAITREISICGYHTALGIFHDNVFNPYNLGSDLMEPFRPLIDNYVMSTYLEDFGPEQKSQIVNILNSQVTIGGRNNYLLNAMKIYVQSVFEAIEHNDPSRVKDYGTSQ